MAEKTNDTAKSTSKPKKAHANQNTAGGGGAVFGLGLLGALVYYIQAANGFGEILLGILKAILWPAFLIYELLVFVGA